MSIPKKYVKVDDIKLAYVESGEGHPIVMLHGNPTSSYLWRNIAPALSNVGRIIIPDLVGHGDSDKLPVSLGADRYNFEVTFKYLDKLLRKLEIKKNITLVLLDWGCAFGFYLSMSYS